MTQEIDILVTGVSLPVSCVLPGCYSSLCQLALTHYGFDTERKTGSSKESVKDHSQETSSIIYVTRL